MKDEITLTTPQSAIGYLMAHYEAHIRKAYELVREMKKLGFEQPWIKVENLAETLPVNRVCRIRLEVR